MTSNNQGTEKTRSSYDVNTSKPEPGGAYHHEIVSEEEDEEWELTFGKLMAMLVSRCTTPLKSGLLKSGLLIAFVVVSIRIYV